MIGKISSGASFGGLIRYITDPEKQQWIDSRNLLVTRPPDVIQEMDMVANRSRATSPVYHISVSWNPNDDPSKFDMMEVADRVLSELQMERNQTLIVSHKDTGHPHIHMAINRVDPETFKAVDRWNDMGRVEGVLREIEKEKGWQETPGLLYGDPSKVKWKGEKLWEAEQRVRVNEALKGVGIGEPEYKTVRVMALEVKKNLYHAKNWKSFDDILAGQGLWVESKGAGMVVTDGAMSIKASSVGRDFSRGKLEKKFGESLSKYEEHRELKVDVKKGIGEVNNWTNAIERIKLEATETDLERSKKFIDAELRKIDYYDTHLKILKDRIQEGFEKTFDDPDKAQQELARVINEEGLENAGAELVSDPRRFGKVKLEGWMLQKLGNDISEMNQKYKEWETYLEEKIIRNPKELSQRRKELKEKQSHLSNVKLPGIRQALRKNMRESEAGYTLSRGAEEVIAVSRAISAIMKNYQPLAKKVAGRGVAAFKNDLAKETEAGQALVQMSDQSMKATRLFLQIATALKSGGVSLAQSGIRHAVHQHRYTAIQKQLEREREAQRGDFSR
ncbi:hypothetical protein DYD21_04040 [Rhodohalobacter sp. SW132]|uniref:relaxase/mobilization nuclease domain-containing protein n=1 Tax=Rhodohalobacter sp. SW132 TaxID=2293433 RepID=UPI000E281739|nr:relaxase/mobilization nuclease domain-containing protein [Rhodohalobacter sp. SW132]REL39135.1 hypothetical protein DYD21_04040 [Rhodohalobacter sp. SW132]